MGPRSFASAVSLFGREILLVKVIPLLHSLQPPPQTFEKLLTILHINSRR